ARAADRRDRRLRQGDPQGEGRVRDRVAAAQRGRAVGARDRDDRDQREDQPHHRRDQPPAPGQEVDGRRPAHLMSPFWVYTQALIVLFVVIGMIIALVKLL